LPQIFIKCRLFNFSEKLRLIRIEYWQKASDPANRHFKPSC